MKHIVVILNCLTNLNHCFLAAAFLLLNSANFARKANFFSRFTVALAI